MVKESSDPKGGVYLLYGKEDFLKREFIRKLRQDFFPAEQNTPMGFEEFTAPEHSLAKLNNFLCNASFFAARKMAVFYGIDELDAEDRQKLFRLSEEVSDSSILVLVSNESNIKKDNFMKALAEKAHGIACHLPFEKDLPQWVESRMKKLGKTIEKDAVHLLIERAGKDAALMNSAVEQLALYTGQESRILLAHAQALLGRSVQADAFRLLDLLLEKKLRSALENLEILLLEGAKIYEIIGALSGQVERLSRARAMMDEGFPSESISAELKLHPFFAGRILEQAEKVPKVRYRKIFKYLLECDEAVKTGRLMDRIALQRLFLRICSS